MEETLEPIRTRREEFAKNPDYVRDVLKKGSETAREIAAKTLHDVRRAMGINYFEDD